MKMFCKFTCWPLVSPFFCDEQENTVSWSKSADMQIIERKKRQRRCFLTLSCLSQHFCFCSRHLLSITSSWDLSSLLLSGVCSCKFSQITLRNNLWIFKIMKSECLWLQTSTKLWKLGESWEIPTKLKLPNACPGQPCCAKCSCF